MNSAFHAPISAAQAAAQGKQWAELQSVGERLCWLEFDPDQGATRIRCRHGAEGSELLTPTGYSVRSRVHEYGGGSYRLLDAGLVFVNDADQGLYWQGFAQPDQVIRIYQFDGFRYGDLQFDARLNRIIAVEEEHADSDRVHSDQVHSDQVHSNQVHNRLVAISLASLGTTGVADRSVLVEGADFYSSPRLNADASKLAWISWDHPHQPWTSTQLWLTDLDPEGLPLQPQALTSGHLGEQGEAVLQPEFGPDGTLFFISDRNGWWNLYRYLFVDDMKQAASKVEPSAGLESGLQLESAAGFSELLLQRDAEFARAPWQLGQQAYVVLDRDRIGCSWWHQGKAELGVLHLPTRQLLSLGSWAAIHSLAQVNAADKGSPGWVAIAESGSGPGQLLGCAAAALTDMFSEQCLEPCLDLDSEPKAGAGEAGTPPWVIEQLRLEFTQPRASVVQPQHLCIPTTSGDPLYGLLYRPAVTPGQRLPLIIQLHGGPTAQADARFDPLKQFWLQRGFALLDLNYRGSSGYGRHYRQLLQGQWGVSDVADVIDAAKFLTGQNWVDSERLVVRGNSAGGYTLLQVLSQDEGQQWLRAGASHYGISDLARLATQTHKFESKYLDWLVGDPDRDSQRYRLRSPIHRQDKFSRPLIFFQGGLDRVVPATQTYTLYNQLKGRGVAVDYLAFADERHGFRQAKNRARVLQREWAFYAQQLDLADVVEPLLHASLKGSLNA